mgnify:CR=1 FL=1
MKRLMLFVGAIVLIAFAVLLQLDVNALYRLAVSGVNDTPIGMYVLWLFPTLFGFSYPDLGQHSVLILIISDALLIGGLLIGIAGLRYEDYGDREYHF